jgi:CxxC motif-containing protein
MAESTYTCIICPRSCCITVAGEPDALEVSGHSCKRGLEYALAEHTHPLRTLTTTVAAEGSPLRRLAVQGTAPVPRELLHDCLAQVNAIHVAAPLRMGDVVLANVCGTGVDVVAARDLPTS